MWEVEFTNEFEKWWDNLDKQQQSDLEASVQMLERFGPELSRPYADSVKASRHSNMKELRTQSGGKPLRTFFTFDPRRCAILLIGGDKTGDKRFYEKMIPLADRLYDEYIEELQNEGLI